MTDARLYDVIAVDLESGSERFIERGKTLGNADAIAKMAVYRRGVEREIFKVVPWPHTLKTPRTEGEGS